jgi:putative transposase
VTPLDRWTMSADEIRLIGPDCDIDELFLFEQKRRVQRDRTVSLDGIIYEVDATLVGETVTLRFDPSRRGRPVDVHFKGRKIEQARRVDLYANCFVKRDHATKALQLDRRLDDPPTGLALRDLNQKKED